MYVLKYRNVILGIVILITVLAASFIPRMKAKYNFEEYFPQNDPAVHFYYEYAKMFDSDARLLLLGIKNAPSIFETDFLNNLDSLTYLLSRHPFVRRTTSVTNMTEAHKTPFGTFQIPILKLNREDYFSDSIKISQDPRIMDVLVSKDFKTTAVVLEVHGNLTDTQKDSLISTIDGLCQRFPFSEFHLGGNINTEVRYIRMLEHENLFLTPLFLLATTLVLFVLYRSFFTISVLTVSVVLGLIWLFGYAALISRNFNIATIMFPTIMVVVGMSDLIHFYTKYNQNLRQGLPKMEAITHSLKEIHRTLFLTSLTTAIGFFTLSFSSVPHVKTFGLDATVGVWMAFAIAVTVTPVLLSYLPQPSDPENKNTAKRDNWNSLLSNLEKFVKTRPDKILFAAFLILVISLFGVRKLDTNSSLLSNISKSAPVRRDFMFFENELAGVRALEVAILVKKNYTIDSLVILKEIEKLENYISKEPSIGPVFSPVTFYKSANKIQKGGQWKHYKLPDYPQEDNQGLIRKYKEQTGGAKRAQMVNDDRTTGKLTAKINDLGRVEIKRLNTKIDSWISTNIDTSKVAFKQTGYALLMDKNNEHLINEMFQSLGLAFSIISLIMAYLFRSLKIIIISLIPNILPLIITAGLMGFSGIELNGSSAIIFTISFVIAVDDTIHFLSKFLMETRKGYGTSVAISRTIMSTGKAIIITSLLLAAGYSVCLLSEFREAYYHGVLICFTLLWAMIADLFLLPVLLGKLLKQ